MTPVETLTLRQGQAWRARLAERASGQRRRSCATIEGTVSDLSDTFAPAVSRLYRGAEPWMPCDGVSLVLEVTSSKPKADRETKRHACARGDIPFHLLVDRQESSITLFSDPGHDDYRQHCTVAFGKPLTLPTPFSFDLDTTDFL
ncbi:hypothetical protein GUR47_10990 [Streptomyces tendae]|uniref:Putative restriction endonuclease domain-containing protein n=1 Tax=Streptomyces tendae TaxID=1932 RepID=A0A6B3QGX5_STRTE|nr:hypothetical protein [Streptomyces tendae]